jgi:hypothetical protein
VSDTVLVDGKWVQVLAKIDKDYLFKKGDPGISSVGVTWTEDRVKLQTWFNFDEIEFEEGSTRFRCKDDDGEVYFGGWLYNDDACIMQQIVFSWAMRDAGCTIIEVKDVNDRWTQEIS